LNSNNDGDGEKQEAAAKEVVIQHAVQVLLLDRCSFGCATVL
jgi:hypothetical protein